MADVSNDIQYEDFTKWEKQLENIVAKRHEEEILHIENTLVVITRLFANATRTHRDSTKRDVVEILSARAVNDLSASFVLAKKGFYMQSAGLTRNILEAAFLILDFKINPENEDLWIFGTNNQRGAKFKTEEVRRRIEAHPTYNAEAGKGMYGHLSKYTLHGNFEASASHIEVGESNTAVHFTPRNEEKLSNFAFFALISASGYLLLQLVEEDIYTLKQSDFPVVYKVWKRAHLQQIVRLAKRGGIEDVEEQLTGKSSH